MAACKHLQQALEADIQKELPELLEPLRMVWGFALAAAVEHRVSKTVTPTLGPLVEDEKEEENMNHSNR